MNTIENALSEITLLIGEENILLEIISLGDAETATYPTTQRIKAIIKPGSTVDLQQCMVIVNKYKVPVYPVSRGKNWGYGSRVPVEDGSIIIDLRRLNKITDFDEELGYVTVEPGVTFNQLFQYLREAKSNLLLSTTGGGGESSLIGNTLERGIGTGLYADRFSAVCGFEVVLPDGKIINTGFERFGNSDAAKVYKWGVGPYLDGLFTQSNLGIVTRMTMWLLPCPDYLKIVFYRVDGAEKFHNLIDTIQKMSLKGLVRPTVSIFNNYRVLTSLVQFPWEHKEAIDKASPDGKFKTLLSYAQPGIPVGNWNGEISVRGYNKEHADLQAQLILEQIKDKVDDIVVFEASREEMIRILHFSPSSEAVDKQDIARKILINKYLGIPDSSPLKQCYWRKKTPIPKVMDPDKDQCGLIWVCPIVPFKSMFLKEAIAIIETVFSQFDFEPAISLQCMSERCINVIASIVWDREEPGEDQKAMECYSLTRSLLEKKGFHFYRETTFTMANKKEDLAGDYESVLSALKNCLDPNNILASGRYIK